MKEDGSITENEEIERQRVSPPVRGEYSDEVELIDYLRVLWKYRLWIIGATILSAIAALVVSFLLPPIWEVSMVVEPGRFGSDVFETGTNRPTGKIYFVDTAENVKAKIGQGAYDAMVRALSGWPSDKRIKWDVDVERGASAMRVSLEVKDKGFGLKALEVLTTSLEKEYARKVETFQGSIEQEIIRTREDIAKVEKDIERVQTDRDADLAKLQEQVKNLKTEIALLEQRRTELSREEENVRKNTELLMVKRNDLIEGGQTRNDPLALVLYTTSLQQNIAYLNQLVSTLSNVRREIEGKASSIKQVEIERLRVKEKASLEIKKLESDVQKIRASIKAFEERKNFAKPIEIIQEPNVSYKPVKPKKKLNAAIAGVLGLFISVFGAFFTEYISGKREQAAPPSRHES